MVKGNYAIKFRIGWLNGKYLRREIVLDDPERTQYIRVLNPILDEILAILASEFGGGQNTSQSYKNAIVTEMKDEFPNVNTNVDDKKFMELMHEYKYIEIVPYEPKNDIEKKYLEKFK